MKIYLAGGMGLMNVAGREREVACKLAPKYGPWRRLFSYHFKELFYKVNIGKINEDLSCHLATGTASGPGADQEETNPETD